MNKTSIEWAQNPDGSQGYTWNPITGCLNHVNGLCKGGGFPCYAYKLANGRLKKRYLANKNFALPFPQGGEYGVGYLNKALHDPFYPRFWEEKLNDGIFSLGRKAKGIFVCDMGDLFGIGVPEDWTRQILAVCRMSCYQQHRFYLLTKQPQRLREFSPFPENCWVGLTLTDFNGATHKLADFLLVKASLKFLSLEPLLGRFPAMAVHKDWFQWLIIGACTGSSWEMVHLGEKYNRDLTEPSAMTRLDTKWALQPRIEWVREIVQAADRAGIPVFLKDNLNPLLSPEFEVQHAWAYDHGGYRQEMPRV